MMSIFCSVSLVITDWGYVYLVLTESFLPLFPEHSGWRHKGVIVRKFDKKTSTNI